MMRSPSAENGSSGVRSALSAVDRTATIVCNSESAGRIVRAVVRSEIQKIVVGVRAGYDAYHP